jgi:hypothetical protein
MTLQQLITSVSNNLGDRASGTIGGNSVESVILQGTNHALPQCVKLANPEYYDRTLALTLTAAGGTQVELPPVTIGSKQHEIKDIVYHRTSRVADGTPISITKKTWYEFMKVTTDYDQQETGIPCFFAFREGNLYINRIPEEDYTMTLFVEVWPVELTTQDYELSLPINSQWELAVEAYTTYYCYLKLQQAPLATYWKDLYEDQKSVNTQQDRKTDIRGQGDGGGLVMSGNPELNPFVNSFN